MNVNFVQDGSSVIAVVSLTKLKSHPFRLGLRSDYTVTIKDQDFHEAIIIAHEGMERYQKALKQLAR